MMQRIGKQKDECTFSKMGGREACDRLPSSALHSDRKLCRGDLGDLGDLGGVQNSKCSGSGSGRGAGV